MGKKERNVCEREGCRGVAYAECGVGKYGVCVWYGDVCGMCACGVCV